MRRKLSGARFRVMVVVRAGTGGVERVVVMGWYSTCGWARSEGELLYRSAVSLFIHSPNVAASATQQPQRYS